MTMTEQYNHTEMVKWVKAHLRRARPDARRMRLWWTEDETVRVNIDDARYVHEMGSDDDVFYFVNIADRRDVITVPLPPDDHATWKDPPTTEMPR